METLRTLRHEYKYVIPLSEALLLKKELEKVLTIDRDSEYTIRSLYFDDMEDGDYYSKLDGDMIRKKVRLRIYDTKGKVIKLEVKNKNDIHQLKESLLINKDVAIKIINGNYEDLLLMDDDLSKKLYTYFIMGYRPKIIIEYLRLAFISTTNTRITLDFDIKKSDDFERFFEDDLNYFDLINKNEVVLEVKYDNFLEPYISKILSNYTNRFQSVSKYVLGRNVI